MLVTTTVYYSQLSFICFLGFTIGVTAFTKENRGLARAPTDTTDFSIYEDLAACGTDATVATAEALFRARRLCGTHR